MKITGNQNPFSILFNILMISCLLIACAKPDDNDNVTTAGAVKAAKLYLNDTGMTNFTQTFSQRGVDDPLSTPLTSTPDASAPNQDADLGKDRAASVSQNDGNNGFKFTRLDENGVELSIQPTSYTDTPWSCVIDENTGFVWEVKTISGLQSTHNKYSWYNTDITTNGGNAGTINNGESCFHTLATCNTEAYVNAINNLDDGKGLCGLNQWRLPLREELRSIIDYSLTEGPMIDLDFFPNTANGDTWTSQTAFYNSSSGDQAWEVHFNLGYSEAHDKSSTDIYLRLVHDGIKGASGN